MSGYVQCNDTEGFGECLMCTGEACNKCGAGCWSSPGQHPHCEHGIMERHEEPGIAAGEHKEEGSDAAAGTPSPEAPSDG